MGKCIASHRREGQKTRLRNNSQEVLGCYHQNSLSIGLHHAWLHFPPLQVGIFHVLWSMASGSTRLLTFQLADAKGKVVFSPCFHSYKPREGFWLPCWPHTYAWSSHLQESVVLHHIGLLLWSLGWESSWNWGWKMVAERVWVRCSHMETLVVVRELNPATTTRCRQKNK